MTSSAIVSEFYIDDNPENPIIGYACQNVLQSNTVDKMEQIFYMDLLSSKGTQELSVQTIQQGLVQAIAARYQIRSGIRCQDIPVDGSTWIVEFKLEPNDFQVVDMFNGCRSAEFKESMDTAAQDCNFYKVTLRGSYVGTTDNFRDVITFVQRTVDSQTLVDSLNGNDSNSTIYATKFQGYPQDSMSDPLFGGNDAGREHLHDPSNLEGAQTAPPSQDRTTITIVGGLLVAAFGIALVFILFILWRRRQAYLQSRHVEFSNDHLDKLSVAGEGPYNGSDPDLEPYNTSNTDEEEDEMEHGGGPGNNKNSNKNQTANHVDISHDSSVYIRKDEDDLPPMNTNMTEDDLPSPTEGHSGTMQFDLGSSFKDQLMGLHGRNQSNNPKRGGGLMSSFGVHGLFPQSGQSLDGDSDADSWAQTDGTIGSLELQLEPITAEV
ncbi:hypothetical protein IV203_010889 [Nitzschia inconspicua]|uniref:Uncharacterized protein n=1 Tax=Nitzschia inconspicua TaxID=303405 RepID=A0A9K3KWW6_9STRA|nr:hypothetical protein IV203_010889 [Nitzschia inconspicua]